MSRLAAVSILALCAPAMTHAADARAENCEATAGIVQMAVEQRRDGKAMQATTTFLTSDAAGIDDRFDPAIPALVDWVYSLDAGLLGQDVAGTFRESCMAYDG